MRTDEEARLHMMLDNLARLEGSASSLAFAAAKLEAPELFEIGSEVHELEEFIDGKIKRLRTLVRKCCNDRSIDEPKVR